MVGGSTTGIRIAVLDHVGELVSMDSKAAAQLIVRHFADHTHKLVQQLKDEPMKQFNFFNTLVEADLAQARVAHLTV